MTLATRQRITQTGPAEDSEALRCVENSSGNEIGSGEKLTVS